MTHFLFLGSTDPPGSLRRKNVSFIMEIERIWCQAATGLYNNKSVMDSCDLNIFDSRDGLRNDTIRPSSYRDSKKIPIAPGEPIYFAGTVCVSNTHNCEELCVGVDEQNRRPRRWRTNGLRCNKKQECLQLKDRVPRTEFQMIADARQRKQTGRAPTPV